MYNVVCSANIGGMKTRMIYRRIIARNIRTAKYHARVEYALAQQIPLEKVKAECYCKGEPTERPALCVDESVWQICKCLQEDPNA